MVNFPEYYRKTGKDNGSTRITRQPYLLPVPAAKDVKLTDTVWLNKGHDFAMQDYRRLRNEKLARWRDQAIRYQEAVYLREVMRLSPTDVGMRLGITESRVRQLTRPLDRPDDPIR